MIYIYIGCFTAALILIFVSVKLNRLQNLKFRDAQLEYLGTIYKKLQENSYANKPSNITEWSYQRFCNFFESVQPKDPQFEEKISKIYYLIVEKGLTDLDDIAEQSGCLYDELLLKIKYLKNKRKIGNLYVDRHDHVIRECTEADEKMLSKYEKYIYELHLQPREIAQKLPGASIKNLDSLEQTVLDEISYLDDKYLINGLNVDKVDKKIIYYTLEKHKKEKDYISINCDKCGALVEVPRDGKERCSYCKNIVEDKVQN